MNLPFRLTVIYIVKCKLCDATAEYKSVVYPGAGFPIPMFYGWTTVSKNGWADIYCPDHKVEIDHEASEVNERNIDPKIEATITTGDRGETEGC